MSSYTLYLPSKLDLASSLKFVTKLHGSPQADKYIFDCKYTKWVEPFGLLFVTNEILSFYKNRSHMKCSFRNFRGRRLSYAGHMGFFKAIKLDYGNNPGEAPGNENYLPITILRVEDLEKQAAEQYHSIGKIIEKYAIQLACLLAHQQYGDLVDTLSYSFQEIIRNVVEHSKSDILVYCAQYWPSEKLVEIALIDNGVGIRSTLSNNPHLNIENDAKSLSMALTPGVSGKMYKGKKSNPHDFWENAGMGLYLTSRICSNSENFFISSGNAGALINSKGKWKYQTDFSGTALRLKFRTDNTDTIQKRIKHYLKEGDVIAKEYIDKNTLTASRASRLVSNDFNK